MRAPTAEEREADERQEAAQREASKRYKPTHAIAGGDGGRWVEIVVHGDEVPPSQDHMDEKNQKREMTSGDERGDEDDSVECGGSIESAKANVVGVSKDDDADLARVPTHVVAVEKKDREMPMGKTGVFGKKSQ